LEETPVRKTLLATIFIGLLTASTQAAENTLDCDRLPQSAVIDQMTARGAAPVCREVMKVLDGPTIEDVLGLPIIGRLLGHTQAATTARYAHLGNDPLRRASEAIAARIAAALEGNRKTQVVPLREGNGGAA
jgi:hypothetical protein